MPIIAQESRYDRLAPASDDHAAASPFLTHPDYLDADRIDFGAWLLPPVDNSDAECIVRLVSTMAGPVAVAVAVAVATTLRLGYIPGF
ncbi:hypothetical protein [Sphingomonas solaris]|uniref:Uncharacterized protein n=1 Tax=Alterirhizorhabdus solaris TaxID=2529389 RepID=A0A558QRK7_9SPHN|nr:hypothetical protein [Sphingomonas solaris]TVV69744.1 hypothetical protein FOY91_20920 [Sphingomonas solaris]